MIKGLLNKDANRRLGAKGIHQIMDHPFFEDINWEKLERKEVKPPYVPSIRKSDDIKYIDDNWLEEEPDSSPEIRMLSTEKADRHIKGFSFIGDNGFNLEPWDLGEDDFVGNLAHTTEVSMEMPLYKVTNHN